MSASPADVMQSLYSQFGELEGISIELHKELIAIGVENKKASATVFLQGAQLSHYQRHGEPPLIWCSPLCDYRSGVPLRGGVPICWPWFGAREKNPAPVQTQLPAAANGAHGLVRDQQWQLETIELPSKDLTILTLSLLTDETLSAIWPYNTALELRIEVGETLDIALSITNQTEQPQTFSAALHSYFAISDIENICIDGLDQLPYIDTLELDALEQWSEKQQQGVVTVDREIDRIYHGTRGPITLIDHGWQRAIEISSRGSNSAVVWNPWIEKSRRLSHFADDAYRQMLCIETANADRDFVQLLPSQQHQLAVSLHCRQLS